MLCKISPVVPGDVSFDNVKFLPKLAVLSNELISPQADGSESKRESPSERIKVLKGDMSPWFVDVFPLLFPISVVDGVSCLAGFGLMFVRPEALLCLELRNSLSSRFDVTIVGSSSSEVELRPLNTAFVGSSLLLFSAKYKIL